MSKVEAKVKTFEGKPYTGRFVSTASATTSIDGVKTVSGKVFDEDGLNYFSYTNSGSTALFFTIKDIDQLIDELVKIRSFFVKEGSSV